MLHVSTRALERKKTNAPLTRSAIRSIGFTQKNVFINVRKIWNGRTLLFWLLCLLSRLRDLERLPPSKGQASVKSAPPPVRLAKSAELAIYPRAARRGQGGGREKGQGDSISPSGPQIRSHQDAHQPQRATTRWTRIPKMLCPDFPLWSPIQQRRPFPLSP